MYQSSFGVNNNSAAPKTNLFGQSGAGTTGQQPQTSLFGNANQQTQQPSSTFGQTGSLFGNQPSQGAPGAGLAGASQPQTGSLFGQQQSPTFGQNKPAGGQTSLFGNAQQPGAQTSTGLFGQASQGLGQQTPGAFGNQNNFGQPNQQANQNPASSGFNQPAGGLGGGLGGLTSGGGFNSIAQASQSGFTTNNQTQGLFGNLNSNQTPTAGAIGAGVGAPGAPQNSLFGQQNSLTNQPQTSSLFGNQGGASQGGGGLFNNAATSQGANPGGGFTQQAQTTSSLFNNAAAGGAQQQSGFGLNTNQSGFMGSGLTGGLNQNPQGGLAAGMSGVAAHIYVNQAEYASEVSSRQFKYNPEVVMVVDKARDPHPHLAIQNIRGHTNFKHVSNEMLRLLDISAAKGMRIQNYEFTAMGKYKENPSLYKHVDKLNKIAMERMKNSANDPQPQSSANTNNPLQSLNQGGQVNNQGSNFSSLSFSNNANNSSFLNQAQASTFSTGPSLFNQSSGQQKTTLFGPQGGQQPPQQQTSLFNSNPLQNNQVANPGLNNSGLTTSSTPGQPQTSQFQSLFNTGANQGLNPAGQPNLNQQQTGLFNQGQASGTSSLFNTQPGQPQQAQQSSLFKPNQQAGTNSLFSTQNQPQQQQSSSLFSQQPGSAGGTTSLLQPQQQNKPANAGLSLFSQTGTTPATGQQPTTSLFSTQQTQQTGQQPQQTSSLFNNTSQQQTQNGQKSLFSQPGQPPQAQGQQNSLFSQQPAQNSLFSNQQSQNAPGQQTATGQTSLFNNTGAQKPQGSLFSTQPTGQQTGNSLFNTSTTPQQNTGNSLFSNLSAQNQGQTQGQTPQGNTTANGAPTTINFNLMSVYQSEDPFKVQSGFLAEPSPLEQVQKELDYLKQKALQMRAPSKTEGNGEDLSLQALSANTKMTTDGHSVPPLEQQNYWNYMNQSNFDKVFESEYERERAKRNSAFIDQNGANKSNYYHRSLQQRKLRESMLRSTEDSSSQGYKDLYSLTQIHKGQVLYAPPTQNNPIARYLTAQQEKINDDKDKESLLRPKQQMSGATQQATSSNQENPTAPPKFVKSADILTITVLYENPAGVSDHFEVNINQERDVQDIVSRIKKWLVRDRMVSDELSDQVSVYFKNQKLDATKSLKDSGIVSDSKVIVLLGSDAEKITNQEQKSGDNQEQELQFSSKVNLEEAKDVQLSQIEYPKEPKQGYQTRPAFEEIRKMRPEELLEVENFTVSNEFGSIKFLGKTDISGVDLAQVVSIVKQSAEVYDDTDKEINKPPVGQKLNKPALISLFGIKPKKNQTGIHMEEKLIKIAEQTDSEFISYDLAGAVWEFKVRHFTRYGFQDEDDSDSEEEEEMQDVEQDQQEIEKQGESQLINTGQGGADRSQQVRAEMDTRIGQVAPYESIEVKPQQRERRGMIFRANKNQEDSLDSNSSARLLGQESQKRKLLESDSEMSTLRNAKIQFGQNNMVHQQNQIRQKAAVQRERIEENRLAQKILHQIKQREIAISKADPSNSKKPSDAETADYLAKLGVKSAQVSIARTGKARPSFGPNGELLFVSATLNQIRVVPTTQKGLVSQNDQLSQTSLFQPDKLILKYMSIQGGEISDSLHKMSLNPSAFQDSLMVDTAMDNLGEDRMTTLRNAIDDSFFSKILQQKLPKSTMFASDSIHSKRPLNHFLRDLAFDLAKEYSATKSQAYKEKVKYEFFCFCLMNALFGNPKLHLAQIYPGYRGARTLNRDLASFVDFEIVEENTSESYRLRKNALIEVLRVYCQQEFALPVQAPFQGASEGQIYSRVTQMILNGDLLDAVKVLRVNKMNKLALLVSSRVSRGQNREKFGHLCEYSLIQQAQRTGKHELVRLLTIISQDNSIDKSNQIQASWEQDLLQTLLFSTRPDESLADIIINKEQARIYQQNCEEPSLLRSLTRLYTNVEKCADHFKTFNNQLTPKHDLSDYRLRFLVQLCLREYIKTTILGQTTNESLNQNYILIEDPYFCDTISKYTSQLVSINQWKTALVIAMTVPQSFQAIKGKLLIQIINSRGLILALRNKNDHEFVTKTLHLPVNLIQTSLALCYQVNNDQERAIQEWLAAENYEQAHKLLYTRVLPHYMGQNLVDLGLQKALEQTGQNQAVKASWVDQNEMCKNLASLDSIFAIFEKKQAKIGKYEVQVGLVHQYLKLITQFKNGDMHGDQYQTASILLQIQNMTAKCSNKEDPIHQFILGQLKTIGANFSVYAANLERLDGDQNLHLLVPQLSSSRQDIEQNASKAAREVEKVTCGQLFATCTSAEQRDPKNQVKTSL